MRGWSAVLVDLDGTLADTLPLILRCYRHTMRVHRGRELPDELWLRLVGRPLVDSLAEFAESAEECRAMEETYVSYQREHHDRVVRAFPGAEELVRRLERAEVPRAVVTSKKRDMALRTLRCCGLEGRIGVLVAADDVARGKPHPEPVRSALEQLGLGGVDPGEVLFLGDSPYDIRAGKAVGVRTAAVLWGAFGREELVAETPDWVVERIEEVPEGPHG